MAIGGTSLGQTLAETLESDGFEVRLVNSLEALRGELDYVKSERKYQVVVVEDCLKENEDSFSDEARPGMAFAHDWRLATRSLFRPWAFRRKERRPPVRGLRQRAIHRLGGYTDIQFVILATPRAQARREAMVRVPHERGTMREAGILRVDKGVNAGKDLVDSVRTANREFWRERYSAALQGLTFPSLLGALAITEDIRRGIDFSSYGLSAVVILSLLLVYMTEVRVLRPGRHD
jgi:hypothetical protein